MLEVPKYDKTRICEFGRRRGSRRGAVIEGG
jgi:hypothetical protein